MLLSVALLVAVSISVATALLFICERPSIALADWIGKVTENIVRKIVDFASHPFLRSTIAATTPPKRPT
jgi:hypothetical protein